MRHGERSGWLGVLALLSLALLSGCNAGDLFFRPTPTPVPTRIIAPTFTPTPDFIQALIVITPPSQGTPGVIIIPPGVDPRSLIPLPTTPAPRVTPTVPPGTLAPGEIATATPMTAAATATPPAPESPLLIPTATPIPTFTPTPTTTPTPFILVESGLVSLRTGPGPDYPLVAQLGPNIPVSIVGQNPEGTWFLICCVNGQSVWVAKSHVQAINDILTVPLTLADPPPTPTATATPTDTPFPTPTPTATPYPFQVLQGPTFMPTNNEFLTIWVKVTAGDGQTPLAGYFLNVRYRNRAEGSSFDSRPNTKGEAPSRDFFEFSAPPGPAAGNRVEFNYKYEFLPPDPRASDPNTTLTRLSLIDGYWEIYLTDGSGRQLSDAIQFDTLLGNVNREIFIAWRLLY